MVEAAKTIAAGDTSPSRRPEPKGPLVGLRVLDIGQLLAGPMIATMMADWGADVVKVEQPGAGDPIRVLGPQGGKDLWWKVNGRGKRSVALDLHEEKDQETLRELVRSADILIENFTPGTLEKWNLGYEQLKSVNEGLIMVRVSGYGQTGPYRHKRGFGRSAQSFSGFSSVNGFPDRAPLHPGIPLGDYFAALTAIGAALAAILERQRSGEGQEIDIALYEATFRIMELPTVIYDQMGKVMGRDGTSNGYVSPVGTWSTADDLWFSLTASTQPVAERLLETVGGSELVNDPRFRTNVERMRHRAELDSIMADWVKAHSADELAEICDANDVVYCIEYDMAQVFGDPHYASRESILRVDDPNAGPIGMPCVVPRFSRTPGIVRWVGEDLGASTEEVLSDPDWVRQESLDQGATSNG
jgi:crotonobetainyl-CoA:carnitine CoA-transferase CaiB-like acyl-CoA transferase